MGKQDGFATLQATWDHKLNKGWTLSPFLGIEYTQVNQNSFTETGYDPAISTGET